MRNRVCKSSVFVTIAAVGVMAMLLAGCSALGHDNRVESAPASDKAAAPPPGSAIQNNPNIPPQFKAGIIAHIQQMQQAQNHGGIPAQIAAHKGADSAK